jgi:eukaryotic-like serine/threonine-protein kinase
MPTMATGTEAPRVGRYRICEVIGTGAFATVYRAADERLGQDVAVKVLAENHSLDVAVRERFVEEARRLRRAHGPHLLAVHDVGETERAQPYMVLDWADGGDLSRRVAARRGAGWAPTLADARVLATAVTSALDVLHRHHLVHRDLAPRNLLIRSGSPPSVPSADPHHDSTLLDEGEQLLLADLGLSKDLAATSGLTVSTGTTGFAAPEQQRTGGMVDHRADVWSASALVVWLALDRPPDDDGRWHHDLQTVAGWPRAVSDVLARGLAVGPDDRYPTVGAWFTALEPVLCTASLLVEGDPGHGTDRRRPEDAGRRDTGRRWRKVGLAVLVAVAVAVGAVAGALVTRDDTGPEVRVEQLDGDRQRTVVEDGNVTITLVGPTRVGVGGSFEMAANIQGAQSWVWIGPDGAVQSGGGTFRLTAEGAGRATVRLLAVDQQGHPTEANHALEVISGS